MKKSIALAALCCAAMSMNAEQYVYDFNNAPSFFPYLQAPIEDLGLGVAANFDFIKKDGSCVLDGCPTEDKLMDKNADGEFVTTDIRFLISLADGCCYTKGADGKYLYEGEEPDYSEPFVSYEDGGPTRVVWLYNIGGETFDPSANYMANTEADFVATKHGIQFSRNDHSASRKATYIQFPAFAGPYTLDYYFCATSDSNRNKEQALRCKVVPVINGEVNEEMAQVTNEAYGVIPDKKYIKKTYSYEGAEPAALRVYADGAQLVLMHAVLTTGVASVEDIIAPAAADENAPVYNVMGQRVGKDYKGLVIKNGVKYVQK